VWLLGHELRQGRPHCQLDGIVWVGQALQLAHCVCWGQQRERWRLCCVLDGLERSQLVTKRLWLLLGDKQAKSFLGGLDQLLRMQLFSLSILQLLRVSMTFRTLNLHLPRQ
jgi:hypothetical protein